MKLRRIRRLNDLGIDRMREFLDSLSSDTPQQIEEARHLLTDAATSEAIPNSVDVDSEAVFSRRFDLAEYLVQRVPKLGLPDPARDAGLWAWLALHWFSQLCPVDSDGSRRPGEHARWLPELSNSRRYYRHYVLGPFLVYQAHSDDPHRALVLLSEPVTVSTSELYRGFVEGPMLTCRSAVEAAKALYFDDEKTRLRRGAGAKGPGGSRRLLEVLLQFDRTFDIHSLSASDVLGMLPGEFDGFRSHRSKSQKPSVTAR